MLKKVFFLIILLLIQFGLFPYLAFADINNIEIIQNPNPVTVNDSNMTITVKSKDGSDIFLAQNYSFAAWTGRGNFEPGDSCAKFYVPNLNGNKNNQLVFTKSQITTSWKINHDCEQIGAIWHFELWAGKDMFDLNNSNNIIVKDYQFTFTQPGGTIVTIAAKNPDVYAGQQPIVIISNAISGDTYSFYWDGDRTFARVFPEGSDKLEQQVEFIISKFSIDKPSRQLCMLYGKYATGLVPFGQSCNPSVTFNFKTGQPPQPPQPGTAKCTILPPAPISLNSDVNMIIENLLNGTKVRAFVVADADGKTISNSPGTADPTNSITLSLLKKANTGKYHAVVFYDNPDNKKVCDPDINFEVVGPPGPAMPGAPGAPAAPVDICKDPSKCSKGGGEPCDTGDGRGPTMKTAIGCIHTNPAELVKDLLRFIIAISGGLAFLMMLLGAFEMLTSSGNPESLNNGRSRVTSAVIGLLFVIFAVLLMQVIGWDILRLEGFGK